MSREIKSFNFENESSTINMCFLNWVICILKSGPQDQALVVPDDIILNLLIKVKKTHVYVFLHTYSNTKYSKYMLHTFICTNIHIFSCVYAPTYIKK